MRYVFSIALVLLFVCTSGTAHAAPVKQKNPLFPVKALVHSSTNVSSDGTASVSVIEFTLTATGEDVFVPVNVARGTRSVVIGNVGLVYDIFTSDGVRHRKGISGGFLYSDAEKRSGFYVIPKGETRTFTLAAAYGNKGVVGDEYQVRIGSLRYALRGADRQIVNETVGFEKFKAKEVSLTH